MKIAGKENMRKRKFCSTAYADFCSSSKSI